MENTEHLEGPVANKHAHMKRLSRFVLDANFLAHMHKVTPLQSASQRERLIKEVRLPFILVYFYIHYMRVFVVNYLFIR